MVGHPRREAGIGLIKHIHSLLVTREDHHQIITIVLHHLQENLDRLGAIVTLILGPVEIISLIDEQHTTHRLLQHLPGLGGRMADVLTHQVIAGGGDHMALAHIAEAMQDFRHPLGHRGLTGARPAGERHVEARWGRFQPHLAPGPVHHQQRSDFSDPRLHRPQTHQFLIQLVEHRLDPRRVVGPTQIDGEREAPLLSGYVRIRPTRNVQPGERRLGIRGGHRSQPQRTALPHPPAARHPAAG